MSILYGVLAPEGKHVQSSILSSMGAATASHAREGSLVQLRGRVGMGFQACATGRRSTLAVQPASDSRGNLLTLDGRIDNHIALAEDLGLPPNKIQDCQLIFAAFERWGEGCFARLYGDWALALWWHSDRTLYLARDHAGTRTLYYREQNECLLWSTYLDTFFGERDSLKLSKEFARAYLCGHPTSTLTPYEGIEAVPAAHYLRYAEGRTSFERHWNPLVRDTIRYSTDEQYDEQFRALLSQAVSRRIEDRAQPVIAELSGGMDSSSIVCMADCVTSPGSIQTISYYDDSEPHWNERPYFSVVEAQRKRTGLHIDISFEGRGFEPVPQNFGPVRWPGITRAIAEQNARVDAVLREGGYRSIISGLGGDELLGGVPSALPELGDLLATGRLCRLVSQGVRWSLVNRSPLIWMMYDTLAFTAKAYYGMGNRKRDVPPWLRPASGDDRRDGFDEASVWQRLGCSPSAITNCFTWRSILETLPSNRVFPGTRYEYLYPYLDRDLVEFLLRVPPEQLLQPKRRRYLMRRALRGIVPVEILERRRKAYAIRGALRSLQHASQSLELLMQRSSLAEMGIIDATAYSRCLREMVTSGTTQWWPALTQTALYEVWSQTSANGLSVEDTDASHSAEQTNFNSLVSSR
jgi:asparagine synthase (glutamine-hydrolysing)